MAALRLSSLNKALLIAALLLWIIYPVIVLLPGEDSLDTGSSSHSSAKIEPILDGESGFISHQRIEDVAKSTLDTEINSSFDTDLTVPPPQNGTTGIQGSIAKVVTTEEMMQRELSSFRVPPQDALSIRNRSEPPIDSTDLVNPLLPSSPSISSDLATPDSSKSDHLQISDARNPSLPEIVFNVEPVLIIESNTEAPSSTPSTDEPVLADSIKKPEPLLLSSSDIGVKILPHNGAIYLDRQNFNSLSEKWLMTLSRDNPFYTIQIATVKSKKELIDMVDNFGIWNHSYSYEFYDDRSTWYVLLLGLFETRGNADQVAQKLPPSLQELQPWVRPFKTVQLYVETH